MLPLPMRFDQNEWFILLTIVFGYAVVFCLPKRFPKAISALLILFNMTVALIIDHAIAGPPLDWYDLNDWKEYELFDVISYFMYTPFGLLSAYLYDKFKPTGVLLACYIVLWSLFADFFEWLSVLCHVFIFIKWNTLYSFSIYLVTTCLYLMFFKFILKYFNEQQSKLFKA